MAQTWTTMGGGDAAFPLTRISFLLKAKADDPAARREALDLLSRSYWKPLYAFLRAEGRSDAVAKDLVQGFYASLIDRGLLARYESTRARFRTFLLTCLRSYVLDDGDRQRAEKRGGGRRAQTIEEVGSREPAGKEATPEQAYDRAWALSVLERAFVRWREKLKAGGKERWVPLVDLLERHGYGSLPPVADLARSLATTEPQVRHFLHREAKKSMREEVLAEVRDGTSGEVEAEAEVAYLLRCVRPDK